MHKTLLRWSYRCALVALFMVGLAFVSTVLALRYWVLPDIGQYREDIAASITHVAGQRVTIGAIDANWERLRPHLVLRDIQVYDQNGRPALALQDVSGTLSWWTLLVGELRLNSVEINNPVLSVRRDAEGRIFVAGIELNQADSESGFADWVLLQSHILIRNAVIEWRDEKRQLPALTLTHVNLRMENSGKRHRFGLQATPSANLAGPLDVRADLKGGKVADLATWTGSVYAKLEHADVAAWRSWIPLPSALQQGHGGVTAWLDFKAGAISEIKADVRLNDVSARFSPQLPELALHSLTGRLGWKPLLAEAKFSDLLARFAGALPGAGRKGVTESVAKQSVPMGFEFSTQHLSLAAKNGVNLPSTDFLLRLVPAQGKKIARGEMRTNGLSLEPLLKLIDTLPLPEEARSTLTEIRPQGGFHDFKVSWSGEWNAPQHYAAKGRFVDLGMKPYGKLPGFSGLSGNLDADEKSGTLALNVHDGRVEFPGVFADALELDALTAQMNWKVRDKAVDLNLTSVSLANPHLAGTLFGSYKMVSGTPGAIDLSGQFTRGDARFVGRYIPLMIGQSTRDWLNTALLAGQSKDVRLRLKGNLADFPFIDGKKGLFEVAGKVTDGTLEYAPGWPKIENIVVDLLFRNARMDITAHQGNTDAMRIVKTNVNIPDLMSWDEMLHVDGEANGPTSDMLKFIDQSPVSAMIDGVTEDMAASGNGKFELKLLIPLRRNKDSRVAGSYRFINNHVSISEDLPALDQVNGQLTFTESGVNIPRITGQVLGGPASISGATQKDGNVRINALGRITAAGLRGMGELPVMRNFSGAADWRGVISTRKKQADVVIESSLAGLGINLPAPFGKKPAEVVPLRLEKKMIDAKQDLLRVNYGKNLAAVLSRHQDNGKTTIDHGAINLGAINSGAAAVLPTQPGLWVSGELASLDLDYWREMLATAPTTATPSSSMSAPDLAGLNMKFGSVDVFGKRFNDMRINAKVQTGVWQASVQSKELAGNLNWNPAGRGRLQARLSNLVIPDAAPAMSGATTEPLQEKELPALDVVADNFTAKQKKLGKLEVLAVQENDDWRIEKLRISNPDGSLQMGGLWQGWRRKPTTQANLHIEAQDLGKFLGRLGYPEMVKRGKANLDGQLSWAGSPHELDLPSLSGTLTLKAEDGQFIKLEPGVGKLLGLLSLQSLPRRLTLDFRDIFSDGFAFNLISGVAHIDHGVARTDDFKLNGPAAKVTMQGETDLARETQNLRVKVLPQLGEGVSVATGFLAGPIVGLGLLAVQKLLKDPIDQIAAYEYSITGTWDNPNVVKIGEHVLPENPATEQRK